MHEIDKLSQILPEFVTRKCAERATGELVKARTLANLDSLGKGPKKRVRLGRQIAYPKAIFLEWLQTKLEVIEND